MTKDIIERNRELYIKEFKATGRQGVDHETGDRFLFHIILLSSG